MAPDKAVFAPWCFSIVCVGAEILVGVSVMKARAVAHQPKCIVPETMLTVRELVCYSVFRGC